MSAIGTVGAVVPPQSISGDRGIGDAYGGCKVSVHDVIGVGFGPANIALAIALEELYPDLTVEFLERRPGPAWQANQLLRGVDIQHSPYRDFVTPRNPRSYYSFTNFLHEHDRLLKHLNADFHFPLRLEYAEYITWAAKALGDVCRYDSPVTEIVTDEEARCFEVLTGDGTQHRARAVVLAPGRTPLIPDTVHSCAVVADRLFHASDYLSRIVDLRLDAPHSFVIVGGSQSAIEIILDLYHRFPNCTVENITPSLGYGLKDTSPFTEQAFLPWFTDYYFSLEPPARRRVDARLRKSNYGVADADVIYELTRLIYEDDLRGRSRVIMHSFSHLTGAHAAGSRVSVDWADHNTGHFFRGEFDYGILATGYRDLGPGDRQELVPPLLGSLASSLRRDREGCVDVRRDYSVVDLDVRSLPGPLFLNGLCEGSHGLGDSGSFSLLSLRAETIANGLYSRLFACTETPVRLGVPHPGRER